MKLLKILKEMYDERVEKNMLSSAPNNESITKFNKVTEKLNKYIKTKVTERDITYNTDEQSNSMFKPSVISNAKITQHIGEYSGGDFKKFTEALAKFYENAGFKVEMGYGIDEIKGFEVKDNEGEVIGEVDFLEKDAVPNHGHTIIIKQKSNKQ